MTTRTKKTNITAEKAIPNNKTTDEKNKREYMWMKRRVTEDNWRN